MKSENTNKLFPKTKAEWDTLVTEASGTEEASRASLCGDTVVTRSGGFEAVRKGLEQARGRGERGAQKAPTKERITIRLSPDVVQQFRASGSGWQARIDSALKDWLKEHPVTP